MGNPKITPRKAVLVRVPFPLYQRLIRHAADQSVRLAKPVSTNTVILELMQKALSN